MDMMKNGYILLVFGMGVVTFIPRWIPLFFLARRNLPRLFVEWLDLIPAAIISALLLPALITTGEPRQMMLFQLKSFVAIPTFVFALRSKSLGGTVLAGMLLYWLVGKVL